MGLMIEVPVAEYKKGYILEIVYQIIGASRPPTGSPMGLPTFFLLLFFFFRRTFGGRLL